VEVAAVDAEGIEVVRLGAAGCSGCAKTCSAAAVGQMLKRQTKLRLLKDCNFPDLRIGDRLLLGVSESELLGVSLRVYLLPLAGLFAGALGGAQLVLWLGRNPDLGAASGAVLGLLAGFTFLRRRNRTKAMGPVILRKLV